MTWSFEVPGKLPSVNHSYRVVKRGSRMGLAKTAGLEDWQTGVAFIVRVARPTDWIAPRRVRLLFDMYFEREGRDGSNALKALEDAIAHGLGVNDSTFLSCIRSKEVDRVNPRVEVTVDDDIENVGSGRDTRSLGSVDGPELV